MTRKTRRSILYNGCYAHVMSRAVDGRFIFREKEDFETFKKDLGVKSRDYGFLIHHYCLMNTHFHLLIKVGELETLSQGLQTLKWRYTHWFNRKYHRMGPLWRERFRSQLIEDEGYLYACGLYIESNPVKAGLVKMPEEWEHSSSRFYFQKNADELVTGYGVQQLPKGFENEVRMEELLRGDVIGSPLFKLYWEEEAPIS